MSFDSASENEAFAEKFSFPFPLLCDTDRSMGLAYGACDSADAGYANRIAVVLDENGTVTQYHSKVDASSFPSEVLASL